MDSTAGIPCHTLQKGAWYLSSYLVNTSMQGEGIGSRFLQECIIPFVKKKGGKKLCLFTNSEINRKFYRKNGFKEFHKQVFRYRGKSLGSWSYVMELWPHDKIPIKAMSAIRSHGGHSLYDLIRQGTVLCLINVSFKTRHLLMKWSRVANWKKSLGKSGVRLLSIGVWPHNGMGSDLFAMT